MIHKFWENVNNSFENNNIQNVFENPLFLQTMYCEAYVKEELELLEKYYTKKQIEDYTKESFTDKVGNNIHQLYHLKYLLTYTNVNSILEFGAGYGSFCCRSKRVLGDIPYSIIDLPNMQKIQKEYLKINNVTNVKWYNNYKEYLNQEDRPELLVALWSLSECPDELRRSFLDFQFDKYFFAYGDSFFDIENNSFFEEIQEFRKDLNWTKIQIPFITNQYYLFGI